MEAIAQLRLIFESMKHDPLQRTSVPLDDLFDDLESQLKTVSTDADQVSEIEENIFHWRQLFESDFFVLENMTPDSFLVMQHQLDLWKPLLDQRIELVETKGPTALKLKSSPNKDRKLGKSADVRSTIASLLWTHHKCSDTRGEVGNANPMSNKRIAKELGKSEGYISKQVKALFGSSRRYQALCDNDPTRLWLAINNILNPEENSRRISRINGAILDKKAVDPKDQDLNF